MRTQRVTTILTTATVLAFARPLEATPQSDPVVTDFDAYVVADPTQSGAAFGSDCELAGNRLAASAHGHENASNSDGAVFLLRRGPGGWIQEQLIPAPTELEANSGFGWELCFEPPRLIVGAATSGLDGSFRGACVVYEDLDGDGAYELEQTLPPPPSVVSGFGAQSDLDGDVLVVGAPDTLWPPTIGHAYVFRQVAGVWTLEADLVSPLTPDSAAQFGRGVGIADGRIAIADPSPNQSVHVFAEVGGTWTLEQTIPTPEPGIAGAFGYQMFFDGELLVVADPSERRFNDGKLYIFEPSASGWELQATLQSPPAGGFGEFGYGIDRSGDLLTVGDPNLNVLYTYQRFGAEWVRASTDPSPFPNDSTFANHNTAVDESHGIVATGVVGHAGSQGLVATYRTRPAVSSYCAGDGSAAACPCANAGGAGAGCANSTGAGGSLDSVGSTSVSLDDLRFVARDLIPGQAALLFVGTETVAGGAGLSFGDGLRCAGGMVTRLGIVAPNPSGHAFWSSGLAAIGGWQAGDGRAFQAWYRDPVGGPCATGFNLTQGLRAEFVP